MIYRFRSRILALIFFLLAYSTQLPAALSCPEVVALLGEEGAATHMQGARWLHGQRPQLHISEPVEEVIEALAQSKGIRLQKPADKISRWLEYMRLAMETEGLRDKVREKFLEEHVLRPEEVPESHYELQRRIAKELGHGDVPLTPELREALGRTVVENQRESLKAWWDYLSSNDAKQYPAWARVFVLGEVARMGRFDAETGKFTTRSKNQVASFPELNREALAKVISELEEHAQRGDRRTFSFSENYGRKLTESIKERGDPAQTDGQWVKYPKDSDPEKLSKALDGWNTGWCTTDCGTAGHQLKAGDFYVYYSLDKNGLPRVPRLAIRMEGERIAEVRGIAKEQNVDSHMAGTAVLDEKLTEFGGQGDLYRKRSQHMRRLTGVQAKVERKEELSPADLWFLYEMNGPIQGFGYNKDPRVAKILQERKLKTREDLARLLAFFAGSRGKRLTGAALDNYAHEHSAAIAKTLGAKKGWLIKSDVIDLNAAFNQFKESLATQDLSQVASLSRLLPESSISADIRRALAENYVANVNSSRMTSEVIRHWSAGDQGIKQFAKEVLAVGRHGADEIPQIPMMRAFSEIEKISNDAKISHQMAAEKWLSDPSREIDLKAQYLRAHVTSEDFDQLEASVPMREREAVKRELSRFTNALTFRELAKKHRIPAREFAKYAPESFERVAFTFPKEGKTVTLGSPAGEEGRFGYQENERATTFKKPFALQATSVTNAQYRLYLEETGRNSKKLSELRKKDPNEPVVEVNWSEAQEYADWLGQYEKKPGKYFLPTEAQSEYGIRGGTTTRYPFGDSLEDLLKGGWVGGDSGNAGGKIHPVAQKKANPYGIYDPVGNNWVWTSDV